MTDTSVLIAARNAEHTIESAIRSALVASRKGDEVLVMDDASDDRTVEVVKSVKDRRLHLFEAVSPGGSGLRRTELLAHARGDRVAILDADDMTLPWRFRISRPYLRTADIVFGSALRLYSPGLRVRPGGAHSPRSADVPIVLAIHNPVVHSTVYARTSALRALGGYRAMQRGQDYDLWLRAASSGISFAHMPLPTAIYRQSATQISRSPDYMKRITANPEISDAYRSHVTRLFPTMPVIPHDADLHSAQRIARPFLLDAVQKFPRMPRRYYTRLVNDLI